MIANGWINKRYKEKSTFENGLLDQTIVDKANTQNMVYIELWLYEETKNV